MKPNPFAGAGSMGDKVAPQRRGLREYKRGETRGREQEHSQGYGHRHSRRIASASEQTLPYGCWNPSKTSIDAGNKSCIGAFAEACLGSLASLAIIETYRIQGWLPVRNDRPRPRTRSQAAFILGRQLVASFFLAIGTNLPEIAITRDATLAGGRVGSLNQPQFWSTSSCWINR